MPDWSARVSVVFQKNTPTFMKVYRSAINYLWGDIIEKDIPLKRLDYKYVISSRLVYECFHYLNRDRCNESLVDISGIQLDENLIIMERMEYLQHDTQTSVYARSNLISTYKTLMKIDTYGGLLTGVFHIHPGKGPESIRPSVTDINDQMRREKVGMKAIGAIFSRDGFFRFFSKELGINIEIVGKGVKKHDRHLYQLENTCNL